MDDPPPPYSVYPEQPLEKPETLILDGTDVYVESDPSLLRYQLSSPLDSGADHYEIRKVTTLSDASGSSSAGNTNPCNVYHFRASTINSEEGRNVVIVAQKEAEATLGSREDAELSPAPHGWHNCVAHGQFTAKNQEIGLGRLGPLTAWQDASQRQVAVGTARHDSNSAHHRLQLLAPLSPDRMDLLIACWLGKLWKETERAAYDKTTKGRLSNLFHGTSTNARKTNSDLRVSMASGGMGAT